MLHREGNTEQYIAGYIRSLARNVINSVDPATSTLCEAGRKGRRSYEAGMLFLYTSKNKYHASISIVESIDTSFTAFSVVDDEQWIFFKRLEEFLAVQSRLISYCKTSFVACKILVISPPVPYV